MPEMTEASLLLGGAVLRALGTRGEQVDDLVARFRQGAYAGLQDLTGSSAAVPTPEETDAIGLRRNRS